MRLVQSIQVVDTHNAGEPMRIITGGIPPIRGATMAEKLEYFQENLDYIRRMTILEPRGHSDMFGGVFCEPISSKAHLGMLFFDTGSYYHMCGHGAMAAAALAVELGMVDKTSPKTEVLLDTPAGLISLEVLEEKGERSVVMYSSPSFLYQDHLTIEIPGSGPLELVLAYGGNFFALVEKDSIAEELEVEQIPYFLKLGMEIMEIVNKEIPLQHPLYKHITQVTDVMFCESLSPKRGRNLVVLGEGQFDRSPCGTGTSARLATLYAQGLLKIGQEYRHESILGTEFIGEVVEEVMVREYRGAVIRIKSRPYIIGFNQLLVEEGDPFKEGFSIRRY